MNKEIRIDPKTPLEDIDDVILTMYNLIINNNILSSEKLTDMDQISNALRYTFHYDEKDVKMFMEFLKDNELDAILWDEPYPNVRSDKLHLRRRLVVGPYSTFPRQ